MGMGKYIVWQHNDAEYVYHVVTMGAVSLNNGYFHIQFLNI